MHRRENQQVAVVLDEWNDALVGYFVEQRFVLAIFFIATWFVLFAPGAGDGIDIKTQLLFILAPAPATVDAPQAGGRRIGQLGQGFLAMPDLGFALLAGADGLHH